MCKLPTCRICQQPFSPEHGDIDDLDDNTGICDACHVVRRRVTLIIESPSLVENVHEEITLASRHCTRRREAAAKNGTLNVHGKAMKAAANQRIRKERKEHAIQRALRLGDQRYRNRRDFTSRLELAEATSAD